MVVQHNMQAMNANRMLNVTTNAQSKSSEKLSSGYRINRAADDAAGLSISEKMRKQIRGLDQASTNAEDGVSAVQTAEGALTEVHDMLQRMNELAVQAANGTNSESDRQSIQDEIDQLTTEIDRVAETTKFNETYLLKGNTEGTSSTVNISAHDAGLDGKLVENGDGTTTFTLNEALEDGDTVTIAGKDYTIGTSGAGSVLDPDTLNTDTEGYDVADNVNTLTLSAGDSVTYDGTTYTLTENVGIDDVQWEEDQSTFTVGEITFTVTADGLDNADDIESAVENGSTSVNISSQYATEYLQGLLESGDNQITLTSFQTSVTGKADPQTVEGSYQLVASLGANEVSIAQLNGDTSAVTVAAVGAEGVLEEQTITTLNAGDSVTISDETTVVTAATPVSAKDTYDAISDLEAGDTVTIGTGLDQKTYTIVDSDDEADEDSYKLTKEMILSKIMDGETVSYDNGTTSYTVIGDIGDGSTTEDVISAKTAYALMADELAKASSIGTDTGCEASVVNNGDGSFTITQGTVDVKDSLSFSLHVGADADMTNKITVNIDSMSAAGLGVQGLKVDGDDVTNATYAIDAIADAISKVSAQRSALGAVQNRLEHTISNLDNVVENTTSAESRIRDTDMAEEMVEYSKNNILAQAGQSMLAQANTATQGVLSLLG